MIFLTLPRWISDSLTGYCHTNFQKLYLRRTCVIEYATQRRNIIILQLQMVCVNNFLTLQIKMALEDTKESTLKIPIKRVYLICSARFFNN